ncbi:MAG: hypothetical protein ACREPM_00445 [Gemmatimonadaceae bacterium]
MYKRGTQMVGRVIVAVVVVGAAACGNRGSKVDESLSRDLARVGTAGSDLQLAPRGAGQQVVVSAIEGGPTSAPAHTVKKPAAKPVTHPAPLRAAPQQTAPSPSAAVVQAEPAPHATPQPPAEPAPLPPFPDAQGAGRARDHGASTEADIFRRMPWIRP